MRTWPDVIAAVIGLSFIIAAHIWLFFLSGPIEGRISQQQKLEQGMVLMPCKLHPRGMDGLPCDPTNELMPVGSEK